jgi:hypothetical protein
VAVQQRSGGKIKEAEGAETSETIDAEHSLQAEEQAT